MIGPLETFGLRPLRQALRQAAFAVRGDPLTPPTRFGPSSRRLLDPALSIPTWLGRGRPDRRTVLYNLFNRTPTPLEEGWSVRVTQVRDYRGGKLTYDSHNGTDFVVPVGTRVVAAAPGRVLRVSSEFHRGGVKVFVDHGRGLVTSYNHLSRALVRPGAVLARGETLALSGASGVDGLTFFPWVPPHVHFNVWLDGEYTDPFAAPGEVSLWRGGELPLPDGGDGRDSELPETDWDAGAVEAHAKACRDPEVARLIRAAPTLGERAMTALFHAAYFPTRFRRPLPRLYLAGHERAPWLDLPFRREDYAGAVFR